MNLIKGYNLTVYLQFDKKISYKTRQTKIAIVTVIAIIAVGVTGVYLIPAQSTMLLYLQLKLIRKDMML